MPVLTKNQKTKFGNSFTEKLNKVALSVSDDKRIQTRDGFVSYPYETDAGRVCKRQLIEYTKKKN